MKQFKLVEFTRVNHDFERKGTILRMKKSESQTKITPHKVEEVRKFLAEKSGSWVRKSAPQFDISPTTCWRIVNKQLHMRFYLHRAVQPLEDDHKEQRMKFCRWPLNLENPKAFVLIHRT